MPRIAAPVRRQHHEPAGEVGHVQRAGDAVDHRYADQEQERRQDVDDEVVHAHADARSADAAQREAVRGRQQELDEDEQVE